MFQICREFDIMSYPTIRYYSPNYKDGPKQTGQPVTVHEENELIDAFAKNLEEEKDPPSFWPNLSISDYDELSQLFIGVDAKVEYMFLVFEKDVGNRSLGSQLILDYASVDQILIRRVIDNSSIKSSFKLEYLNYGLAVVDRKLNTEVISVESETKDAMEKALESYLKKHSIKFTSVRSLDDEMMESSSSSNIDTIMDEMQNKIIYEKVKAQTGVIYRADIEQAVKFSLFHEVPQQTIIENEELDALKRFVQLLSRYFPFSEDGKAFIDEVLLYVSHSDNQSGIGGDKFREKLQTLGKEHKSVFSSNRYVGCSSKVQGLRRYPCSLWTLFHFLTVQAAEKDISSNPLEVLHGMHGYIKYFFGCSDCSRHFQDMAAKNKIWNVTSKDEAVLWLWSSHNEVNKRLSGDVTEDPEFKKIQFPQQDTCTDCRRKDFRYPNVEVGDGEVVNWDKNNVLTFLKNIYSSKNLNNLGIEKEYEFLSAATERYTRGHFASMFSDLDIRMGILLYISMVCIMIVAIKLLVKRGYRKKLYVHDILGKV